MLAVSVLVSSLVAAYGSLRGNVFKGGTHTHTVPFRCNLVSWSWLSRRFFDFVIIFAGELSDWLSLPGWRGATLLDMVLYHFVVSRLGLISFQVFNTSVLRCIVQTHAFHNVCGIFGQHAEQQTPGVPVWESVALSRGKGVPQPQVPGTFQQGRADW